MASNSMSKVNRLLAALPPTEWQRWQPQLEAVELPLGKVLYESGSTMSHVYFPTTAIVSLLYVLEDGASAEIAVVGREGLVGRLGGLGLSGGPGLCLGAHEGGLLGVERPRRRHLVRRVLGRGRLPGLPRRFRRGLFGLLLAAARTRSKMRAVHRGAHLESALMGWARLADHLVDYGGAVAREPLLQL